MGQKAINFNRPYQPSIKKHNLLPLTHKELTTIQNVWNELKLNSVSYGVRILLVFFENHPEAKTFFQWLGNKSLTELTEAEKEGMRRQGSKIINTIGNVIEKSLKDEPLTPIIDNLIKTHRNLDIPDKLYIGFNDSVIKALSEMLGKKVVTENVERILSRILSSLEKSIIKDMEFFLSDNEIRELSSTWNLVRLNLAKNGQFVLMNFWSEYPAYVKYFNVSKMPQSEYNRQMGIKYISYLTTLFEAVSDSDPANMRNIIKQIADIHKPHNLPPVSFQEFRLSFCRSMSIILGHDKHSNLTIIYDQTMKHLINNIINEIYILTPAENTSGETNQVSSSGVNNK